ncbi:MAG: CPBP family intramembrane metalloprotease [Acidobacteria bacterium]|nr:CPBP family intramembrane metalloprotease [Acidobacteriota bacterium]
MPWPPPLSARWTALALFLFALALHLFVAMGGAIAGLDFKLLIIADELGAILLAPVLFTILLGLRMSDAFLFRSAHWGHYVIAGAAAIPLQLFGGALQEIVLDFTPGGEEWRQLLEDALAPLLSGNTTYDVLLLMFGGVVLAAVCEEILFRGLLMQLLARGGRWWFAINVSAVLFAVFHLDFIGLIPRTILGIYFGVLVWRSGSIFPAMVAHAANNLLAFGLSPGDTSAEPPTLLQAGILGLVSAIVFLGMMALYVRLTPRALAFEPSKSKDTGGGSSDSDLPPEVELPGPDPATSVPAPTDSAARQDSTHHTDPHES